MLSDPLYLGVPTALPAHGTAPDSTVSTIATFRRVAQGDGSSKYVAADPVVSDAELKLAISHSVTKENKPYDTERTLVRLDFPLPPDVNGVIVTASAYMVVAVPTASSVDPTDLPPRLVRILALFALYGPSSSSSDWAGITSDDTLARLLNGEA
jgi:hypothetical protein